jgi:hypothetical protein
VVPTWAIHKAIRFRFHDSVEDEELGITRLS